MGLMLYHAIVEDILDRAARTKGIQNCFALARDALDHFAPM